MKKALGLGLVFISLLVCCKKGPNPQQQSPVINSFAPESAAKDSVIIIEGANFSSILTENLVTINDKEATVLTATPTRLSVKVPVHAGNGKIAVSVASKTANSANTFTYLYTVSTFAGKGEPGDDDGPDTTAKFNAAFGLIADKDGNIIVADGGNNKIRKITPAGVVSTIAGDGLIGTRNGAGAIARFNYPRGVATDAAGNIYVADAGNNLIRKITPAGIVSTLAGDGTDAFADGQGIEAKFSFPVELVLDADGNIFVTDGGNRRIRKITPQGLVSTIGGIIQGFPEGIVIDATGNLYFANTATHMIQKMNTQGALSNVAGDGTPGFANGPGVNARFVNPEGLAMDADGNLYVGDLGNAQVRKITPAGEVSTFAGTQRGFKNGIASEAMFFGLSGVAIDKSGNIFVADVLNGRIRKIE
jgi:sugar lactone lactonase YvrE